jgi:sterol desaturase/sphingolipid hydroxylase (fatty acid hydroxylase superfamily)
MESQLVYYFYPIFIISIAIEIYLTRHDRQRSYSVRESLTSLAIFIGHNLMRMLFAFIPYGLFAFAWQHRLFDIPFDRWWSIPLLFISLEFCYYWHHRAAHEIRWIWATHAVHHSVKYFNFSAAYRLGWTSVLSGNILFFTPLVWLGFPPAAVATGLALNLAYQFWIHTELIPKLGILEWVLNTPSHHRVHHASNDEYIDRNYGGVLIIFDRLFGTYAEEKSDLKITYGLTRPLPSANIFEIVLHEWVRIFKDVVRSKTWIDRFRSMFGAPT